MLAVFVLATVTCVAVVPAAGGATRVVHVPAAAVTLVVTSTVDAADASPGNGICATSTGVCTLRAAIQESNASGGGGDTIDFGVGTGAITITPTSALPATTVGVTIDGTSQPGYRGLPIVQLTGSSAGAGADGLKLGAQTTVKGLVINQFSGNGINVTTGQASVIQDNYIGTDTTGTLDRGNGLAGVLAGAASVTIGGIATGGPITGAGNLISGNNGGGVVEPAQVFGAVIEGNLIGGNSGDGILVTTGSLSSGRATIDGNEIGTDQTTTVNLGNTGNGIEIGTSGNEVGENARNTVYFNTGTGIRVTAGNGNPLGKNVTFFNGGLGIDLGTAGVTPNDTKDPDTGANNLQNFPVLGTPTLDSGGTSATVHVALNSLPNAHFDITLFTGPSCDGSGNGEGQSITDLLTDRTADANGNLVFNVSVFADPGDAITAVATQLLNGNPFNTSEYSNCVTVPFAHTFTVNSTGDGADANVGNGTCATSGNVCTLRAAIQETNALAGRDLIRFGLTNVITLTPASALPPISDMVTIDGTTESGFTTTPIVELNGTSAGASAVSGLKLAGKHDTVRGLAINRFSGDGITITNSDATVQTCSIGTNDPGTAALPNGGNGITIQGVRAQIGGATSTQLPNVISGNIGNGVVISSLLARVQQNKIGTNHAGTAAIGNGKDGVLFTAPLGASAGGAAPTFRNVISGNHRNGVEFAGTGASSTLNNSAAGNLIGVGANGSTAISNTLAGVLVGDGAVNSIVGGTGAGSGNVISANGDGGVAAVGSSTATRVLGNLIGTDATGSVDVGNVGPGVSVSGAPSVVIGGGPIQQRNVISGNSEQGIILTGAGASGASITGNTVGLKASGVGALPNDADGIFVQAATATVGGSTANQENIISGNGQSGIAISSSQASGAVVSGNVVGLDSNGSAAGNTSNGISVAGTPSVTIGGLAAGQGNVVSSNGADGVLIAGAGATGAVVEGNRIGASLTGLAGRGNTGAGVDLRTTGTTVGGSQAGSANQISGNHTDGVLISGAGASGNSVLGNLIGVRPGSPSPAVLPNTDNGVHITDAANNTVGSPSGINVIAGNGQHGVQIDGAGATGNTVAGNDIGTDGTVRLPNLSDGVLIEGGSGATIGSNSASNVISGNDGFGITVDADGATLENNLVGVNAATTGAIANLSGGVHVILGDGTQIGTLTGSPNLIGGNSGPGIVLNGLSTTGTTIVHNVIGKSGPGGAPNTQGIAVQAGVTDTLIGGISDQGPAANIIEGNTGTGIAVQDGTGTHIENNAIGGNGGLGIDLGSPGITPNDPQDPDTGANNLQNFPVLSAAVTGGDVVTIAGSLNSTPSTKFTIDAYASPACDPSGNGEGVIFLGSFSPAKTSAAGVRAFKNIELIGDIPAGEAITVTATDPNGNTSEFSKCQIATQAVADVSATLTDSPDPVLHGQTLTYTATGANAGPDTSVGTTLTETLSHVTFVSAKSSKGTCALNGNKVVCDLGDVLAGKHVTVKILVTVSAGFTGALSNTATAAGQRTDPSPANNTSTQTTTVT
jgi:CSLREA domain-containing protein